MPNGHGGNARFFPVIFFLVVAGGLLAYARNTGADWAVYGGYGLAILIGERFAKSLHLWHVENYDGAYATDEEKAGARKTYRVGAVIYVIVAVAAWNLLTTP
jgi:hypothetical protein